MRVTPITPKNNTVRYFNVGFAIAYALCHQMSYPNPIQSHLRRIICKEEISFANDGEDFVTFSRGRCLVVRGKGTHC